MIESLSDEELKKIADDIYKGLIFTTNHIRDVEDIQTVFMPLMFLKEEQLEEMDKSPPGMIYEYMSEALPRCVNGMPVFMSMRLINIEDLKKVGEYYNKIKTAVDNI